jgi:hypothetical protein
MSTIINATTTNGVVIQPDNSGSLVLQTNNGTTAITIDTSQNVGIGVTPSAWNSRGKAIQLGNGSINTSLFSLNSGLNGLANNMYVAASTDNYIATGEASRYYQYAGTHVWDTATSGTAGNTITFTERMRIDSSGNLSLGTTGTAGKFTVVQGNGVASDISNTNTNDVLSLWGNKGNSSASAMYMIPLRSGDSTLRGSIYWTGSAIQFNTSSDYRLKENIAPMTGALDKVLQLKPVTYTWKESGFDGQGFIAHELQEVVPDCVSGEKDAVDEDGKPQYQGIDTSFLVATLTAAIQEQQTIINDLKARVEALEAK